MEKLKRFRFSCRYGVPFIDMFCCSCSLDIGQQELKLRKEIKSGITFCLLESYGSKKNYFFNVFKNIDLIFLSYYGLSIRELKYQYNYKIHKPIL